jgi:hypothetical protein
LILVGPHIEHHATKGQRHKQLFDPGVVTFSRAAVEDFNYIDAHPGQLIADHVCGNWDDGNEVYAMNLASIRAGQGLVVATHWWTYTPAYSGAKEQNYYFKATTTLGHGTHVICDWEDKGYARRT